MKWLTLMLLGAAAGCDDNDGTDDTDEVAVFEPGALGAVALQGEDAIQLRFLGAITGDVQFLGLPALYAMELALDDYGTVAGKSVQMGTPLDEECRAPAGALRAEEVVAESSVVGVIGTSCSGAATGAMPVLSQAGLLAISPSATSPSLTSDLAGNVGEDWHAGFYRTSWNDLHQGKAVAEFLKNELNLTSAAAIHDRDPYTRGLATAFEEAFVALGGTVTQVVGVQRDTTDVTDQMEGFAADGVQAIFFPLFQPLGNVVAAQARDTAGLETVTLIASDGLLNDNFLARPSVEGVYFSGPDTEFGSRTNEHTGKTGDQVLAAYQAAYGESPSASFWAQAYDATTMLLAGIESTIETVDGITYVDRLKLRETLYATSFQGLTGTVACDAFGDCSSSEIVIVQNTDPSDVAATYDNIVYRYSP